MLFLNSCGPVSTLANSYGIGNSRCFLERLYISSRSLSRLRVHLRAGQSNTPSLVLHHHLRREIPPFRNALHDLHH